MATPGGIGWDRARLSRVTGLPQVSTLSIQSRRLPNMRLKLAGADRFKGNGVFVPWRAQPVGELSCAGERVARSLSAIR